MDEDEKLPLYMPYGLKLKKEYFPGYGKQELIPTVIAGILFLFVDVILYLAGVKMIGILFFVPVIGTSSVGMALVKGELNLSPYDIVALEMKYRRERKRYPYIEADEWEAWKTQKD